ncbi:hypothetical protein EYF80_047934 [Liparis tanakae]|uniref:Uncharacterized protein n=1 Tax=Liparis tanakae TaxID=230148 RepID=A0A4Z2FLZ1_9TELE|nr:hypothetical protein EYF80_047934 [Liparis tanakae]
MSRCVQDLLGSGKQIYKSVEQETTTFRFHLVLLGGPRAETRRANDEDLEQLGFSTCDKGHSLAREL